MKKLFYQNSVLIKDARAKKKEIKKDKKVIAWLEAQVEWQTKQLESTSGTKYIPPEYMSSDDEAEDDDVLEEPPF